MLRKLNLTDLYVLLFSVLAFSFFWTLQISTLVLILVGVLWIFDPRTKITHRLMIAFKDKRVWVLVSTYIIALIGLIYSNDVGHGRFILGVSLSLLLFPIIFRHIEDVGVTIKHINIVMSAFVLGALTSSLFCLGMAYYDATHGGEFGWMSFYYVHLMYVPLSPGSYGNYLLMVLILLILFIGNDYPYFKRKGLLVKLMASGLLMYFLAFLYLTSAKASILSLLLVLFVYAVYKAAVWFSKTIAVIGATVLLVGGFFFVSSGGLELFGDRFKGLTEKKELNMAADESTVLRLAAAYGSIDIMKKHPVLGIGTGAVKEELTKYYKKQGYTAAYEHKTDSHNQFLRTFAKNGVIGFVALVATFLLPLILAFKWQSILLFLFGINQIVMGLTGDILDNQPGVVFHSFVTAFLIFMVASQRKKLIQV